MKLFELLENVSVLAVQGSTTIEILSVTTDSRQVTKGTLFIAVKGTKVDGNEFIEKAITAGAVAIVSMQAPLQSATVVWIQVENATAAIGSLAAGFYQHPSDSLKVTGVTGTNGKTTIATLLYKLFTRRGYTCGLISTVETAVVESAFTGRPGVDIVQDQRTILEKFFRLLNVLRDGALVIGLASVLTAALLISNTLRLAAFNRRRETNVMKLVGASSFSIQLPFILEGVISALFGWGFATALLVGFKYVVQSKIAPLLTFTNFFGWGDVWVASAYLLIAGLFVSSLASLITLRKYLKV